MLAEQRHLTTLQFGPSAPSAQKQAAGLVLRQLGWQRLELLLELVVPVLEAELEPVPVPVPVPVLVPEPVPVLAPVPGSGHVLAYATVPEPVLGLRPALVLALGHWPVRERWLAPVRGAYQWA